MGDGNFGCNDNLCHLLSKYIGETVTIFTKSGGQSGCGFTGVILGVNECFVRLITRIGPAPGCSLGNSCGSSDMGDNNNYGGYGNNNMGYGCNFNQNYGGYGGGNGVPVYNVGSVTDIPLNSIASFVHNAV
ncbi:hypothetical protein [Ruminiclostridium cellobioparum]|uniref:hypothetical protein n=1 Tax=Ruminiclostridium cellobioparum TaxID=29355 RepID=UPI000484935E|nr:hypothetical protein [Ruminiclostridium cellobioparum]